MRPTAVFLLAALAGAACALRVAAEEVPAETVPRPVVAALLFIGSEDPAPGGLDDPVADRVTDDSGVASADAARDVGAPVEDDVPSYEDLARDGQLDRFVVGDVRGDHLAGSNGGTGSERACRYHQREARDTSQRVGALRCNLTVHSTTPSRRASRVHLGDLQDRSMKCIQSVEQPVQRGLVAKPPLKDRPLFI